MQKTISVSYTQQSGEESCSLVIGYQLEPQGSGLLISCAINGESAARLPQWLHTKKFEVKTVCNKGTYSMVYNDQNYDHNLDTSLFIDMTYGAIMKQEKMKMAAN